MLELVSDRGGVGDLAELASDLLLEVDDLMTIVDAAVMLGFAQMGEGSVTLTEIGTKFVNADILTSKEIFRVQVMERIPLIQTIVKALSARRSGAMRADFFEDVLEEHFPSDESAQQFKTAVDWGRYAELFEYDAAGGWLTLSDARNSATAERVPT